QLAAVLGISCVAFVAAMLMRGIVDPVIPFTAAVLASAWYFGLQGGLAALAVCGTFALIFTVPPTQAGVLGFVAFVVLNTILTILISRSQERAYRFRSMLGSIGDAVIATNKDGLIRYMNEQAEGLLGVPLEKA